MIVGAKAINFEEGYVSRDYDSEPFRKAAQAAHLVPPPTHAIVGIDMLVYLPKLKVFATYFAATRLQRQFFQGRLPMFMVGNLDPGAMHYLGERVFWRSVRQETQRFQWYSPSLLRGRRKPYKVRVRKPVKVEEQGEALAAFLNQPRHELFRVDTNREVKQLKEKAATTASTLKRLGYPEADVLKVGIDVLNTIKGNAV